MLVSTALYLLVVIFTWLGGSHAAPVRAHKGRPLEVAGLQASMQKRDYPGNSRSFNDITRLLNDLDAHIAVPVSAISHVGLRWPLQFDLSPNAFVLLPQSYTFNNPAALELSNMRASEIEISNKIGSIGEKAVVNVSPSLSQVNYFVGVKGNAFVGELVEIDPKKILAVCTTPACLEAEETLKSFVNDLVDRGSKLAVTKEVLEKAPFLNPNERHCISGTGNATCDDSRNNEGATDEQITSNLQKFFRRRSELLLIPVIDLDGLSREISESSMLVESSMGSGRPSSTAWNELMVSDQEPTSIITKEASVATVTTTKVLSSTTGYEHLTTIPVSIVTNPPPYANDTTETLRMATTAERISTPTAATAATTVTTDTLSSATSAVFQAPPGTIDGCQAFYTVRAADSCSTLMESFSVTTKVLYAWNPSIGPACTQLLPGHAYCVDGPKEEEKGFVGENHMQHKRSTPTRKSAAEVKDEFDRTVEHRLWNTDSLMPDGGSGWPYLPTNKKKQYHYTSKSSSKHRNTKDTHTR
jgi:hypothetical protein